jgi:hypothetical protein
MKGLPPLIMSLPARVLIVPKEIIGSTPDGGTISSWSVNVTFERLIAIEIPQS